MKSIILNISLISAVLFYSFTTTIEKKSQNEFQGRAYYISKSTLELGNFGATMSEAQKKQIAARLKNRLEKKYVLIFNKEESMFKEEEKLDAISGAKDSWGKNFAAGDQYKNIKSNSQIQSQEFYGKKFLVKDNLQPIEWVMGKETKQIGNYTCFKATASVPKTELTWYSFSWDRARAQEKKDKSTEGASDTESVEMTEVVAWYSPQIPVGHGPSEYWGLPGLILEVSADNTTVLCSKLILNPKDKVEIEAPDKGKEVTKIEYQETITEKMKEFRENRSGRRRG